MRLRCWLLALMVLVGATTGFAAKAKPTKLVSAQEGRGRLREGVTAGSHQRCRRLWQNPNRLSSDFRAPYADRDFTLPPGYTYTVSCINDNPSLPQTAGCDSGPIAANPVLSSADIHNGSGVTFKFVAPVLDLPVFVIGDVEPHAVGDVVNFWGAQWGHNNFMSGFVSPGGSFKGYASEVNGSCGGTWETRPGNSSQPPPTIDQPMLIIVTSTMRKNGPVISGNIVQIVQIRHDGSYDGNPGHPGWGTVNHVICTVD